MLVFVLILAFFQTQDTMGYMCIDPKNQDFCIKIGYDSNKLPPNIPLNVDMSLAVIVRF